jgi:beta-lactamase class A
LKGKSAIIIRDRKTNEFIVKYNENEIFGAASIIKLFILWVLVKKIEIKKINWDERINIVENIKVSGFGVLKSCDSNLKPTIKDLATLMIIVSDNTATNLLIDKIGIDEISKELKNEGFEKTILGRKMYDLNAKKQGFDNYTNAHEVLLILEKLIENETTVEILKLQRCNNKIPLYFSGKVPFAHKTGDLPSLEHDAGCIFFKDRIIDIIVLTKELENNKDGIIFNNIIGDIIYNYFNVHEEKL